METTDIDTLVEQKLQELKDLVFLRFMRSRQLEGFAQALIAAAPRLPPAPEPAREPPPTRRAQIAERMKRPLPPAEGRRQRRSHTADFKLGVLRQLDDGAKLADVVAEHQISKTLIPKWRALREEGMLVPDAQAAAGEIEELEPEPSPEVADDEHDLVDAMAGSEAARAEPLPFEEEDSLPIGLARA